MTAFASAGTPLPVAPPIVIVCGEPLTSGPLPDGRLSKTAGAPLVTKFGVAMVRVVAGAGTIASGVEVGVRSIVPDVAVCMMVWVGAATVPVLPPMLRFSALSLFTAFSLRGGRVVAGGVGAQREHVAGHRSADRTVARRVVQLPWA